MELKLHNDGTLELLGDDLDKRYYTESALYYDIKKLLNEKGLDVIKFNPANSKRRGIMMSCPFVICDRKHRFLFFDNYYAIRDLAENFRKNEGRLELWLHIFTDDNAAIYNEIMPKINGK